MASLNSCLKLTVAALSASLTGYTYAAPAFPAKNVEQIKEGTAHLSGKVRLRVSAVIPRGARSVVEGPLALTVCSEESCYRAPVKPESLNNDSNGVLRLAEVAIPPSKIKSVHFEGTEASNSLRAEIALSTPLEIPDGFYGGEIFVPVEQKSGALVPLSATGGLFAEGASTIYYDPKFALSKTFNLGVTLSLPAGAAEQPHVFSVAVHDTGKDFPMVDIYPPLSLAASGLLHIKKMKRPERAPGSVNKARPPIEGLPTPAAVTDTPDGRTIELKRTGTFSAAGRLMAAPGFRDASTAESARADTCAAMLSRDVNKQYLDDAIKENGFLTVDWCNEIPPYVHIVLVDTSMTRHTELSIKFGKESFVKNATRLPLTRIKDWSTSVPMVLLNGFTWIGDEGTSAGQWGLAKGYLAYDTNILGDNRTTGGSKSKFPGSPAGVSDGYKYIDGKFAGSRAHEWYMGNAVYTAHPSFQVSSSTSVMKNGVCSSDSLDSRWSVYGTSKYMPARAIFISSVAAEDTNVNELCPVLRAVDGYNGIRMDGGPSASLVVDYVLKNPLTGLYALKYGPMRHIAYAMKAAWPGK